MNIIHDFDDISSDTDSVVTIGTFDGLHIGHRRIIDKLKESAKKNNCRSVVITFNPHPRTIFKVYPPVSLLSTFDEKTNLFRQTGIDALWVINFTKEFAALSSETFVKEYLINKLNVKEIIIGHDHRFGKDRDGDEKKLKSIGLEYGFTVVPVEAITVEGKIVSSSKIREALNNGDIRLANLFLGRKYTLGGTVIDGEKRGRTLGFPTANIGNIEANKLIPEIGIYAVNVLLEGRKLKGVINIGKRPTFKNDDSILPEVHILDFDEDIYGKKIEVEFVERLRGEKKFSSKEELIEQIKADKEKSREILS